MNRFTGLILALVLGATAGACASGGAGGAGGSGADDMRPKDNRYTREAEQSIALAMLKSSDEEKRQLYQQALVSAQQAIQDDSTNPQGWFLAGQAHVNLGEFEQADAAWDTAEELYPEYGQEIGSERENAWVRAYNEGVGALQQDDLDEAIQRMELADLIYQGRPEAKLQLGIFYARQDEIEKAIAAYRGALDVLRTAPPFELDSATQADWAANEEIAVANLAQLLATSGREGEAEQVFRDMLAADPDDIQAKVRLADVLARQGKTEEANRLYDELIGRDDLPYTSYLTIGVGLFQSEQYEASARAFEKTVRANPYSRDGHYNLAQALFMRANELDDARKAARGAEANAIAEQLTGVHTSLAQAAEKVLELDPFNRNIIAYLARAYQALSELTSDNAAKGAYRGKIQAALKRHEDAPFEVLELTIAPSGDQVTVNGRLTNLKLASGEPIRLRISLLDTTGSVIGSEDVTVSAPAPNAPASFQATVAISGELGGWRYDRIQ